MSQHPPKPLKPSRWLMQYAKRSRGPLLGTVGFGLLGAILLILQAYCIAHLISGAFLSHLSFAELSPYLWGILVLITVRTLLLYGQRRVSFAIGAKVRTVLRERLFQQMLDLGPQHGQRTGALSSALVDQVEAVQDFYQDYLPQMYLAVLVPVMILIAVFPVSWIAGAIFLVTAPLIPLFMALVGMGASSAHQKHLQTLARMSSQFLDILQGISTLKLFNRSKVQEENVRAASEEYRVRTMSVLKIAFMSSGVLELFASGAIALVAIYLGVSLLQYIGIPAHGITLEIALFILLLAPEFYAPLRTLGTHYHARSKAVGAAEELMKLFALKPQALNIKAGQALNIDKSQKNKKFDIAFKNICFNYEDGLPVLNEVSMEFKAFTHTAVVGASGAGKTTLLQLLLGFIQPVSGEILINGQVLSSLNTSEWRKQLSWVGQNPRLFHGSVLDNIRLARPEATEQEVLVAAKAAFVNEFVNDLPQGFNTPLGELGVGLSGGQIQRIALARAYLKDSPILLLDEPMASLDSENEKKVLEALAELAKGRTVIHLTHRLVQAKGMDIIYVLDQGHCVESGDFESLMKEKSHFYRMAAL
ncbi:thiol reductant ABC exporter subunit CydD [Piscirickettsia litoralis]|uniref:Thiol reductant ABC exporter subunit CydD n=1 Tax=Piscirickettsia litoralis TaxID=1891921 RepID=A0ABX3A1H9_9GAMM|nr:thiol reductant ABC exporter subunit CydD [Piscirickettsia litoralis]ODN42303.1 thiol reductant ABC exporter subunit CydD [Piscirickettsia litoralis]